MMEKGTEKDRRGDGGQDTYRRKTRSKEGPSRCGAVYCSAVIHEQTQTLARGVVSV